jgi:hypothetical protein
MSNYLFSRLASAQQEVTSLRQQADHLRQASLNTSSSDSHEQLAVILNNLRQDSDRVRIRTQIFHSFQFWAFA